MQDLDFHVAIYYCLPGDGAACIALTSLSVTIRNPDNRYCLTGSRLPKIDQLRVYSTAPVSLFKQEVHEPHLKLRSLRLGQQRVSM
jgi:hypothetical protein